MRIAVMGAGGTGGYFGGLLARAGEDVTFIARGAHLEAMRRDGLTVKSQHSGDFHLAVQVTDDPTETAPVDLVLFCVKTYDTEAAAGLIRPVVGPETVVLSVQNGIDCEERIAEVIGPGHVLGCVAQVSSLIEAPGVIAHQPGPAGTIIFGELNGGSSPRAEGLLKVLEGAGIGAQVHPSVFDRLWHKFAVICAVSGMTSLTRLSMGPILAHEESRAMFIDAIDEVVSLATARGARVARDEAVEFIIGVGTNAPGFRGSMAYDLEAGKRLELGDLNGTVDRMGRESGVATPINSAIYAALKPFADGAPALP